MHPANDPRALDHLVLPTAALDIARARLTALGFTVAPDGVHPFGTANCCVYFSDGVFLEPLAVANPEMANEAAKTGNVFVAHDRSYRSTVGEEGFSALVMRTKDARADDARFRETGVSAGEMLAFSRPFVAPDGGRDTASFLLAFAADPSAPECLVFTCERVNAPGVDRSVLERHANGAAGVAGILLSAAEPARFARFLEKIARGAVSEGAAGSELRTAGAGISVLTPTALASALGMDAVQEESPRLCAIVFRVFDLAIAENLLARNNVAFDRVDGRVVVPRAAGQGAHFIFEASL